MSALPNVGLYRRATAWALVAGPALFVLDNLLHPREYPRGNEARQLERIADTYTRWQLAHAIGFLAVIVFAAAVLGLAFFVGRRAPRWGLAGGALGIAGLLGGAGVFAIDGYTWGVLGGVYDDPGVDRGTVQHALHAVQHSSWSIVFYATTLLWIAGVAVLAVGASRYRGVTPLAGGLLALGALLVGIETGVTSNAYFIASSLVWLAGGILVARAVARMSDAEFAAQPAHERAAG